METSYSFLFVVEFFSRGLLHSTHSWVKGGDWGRLARREEEIGEVDENLSIPSSEPLLTPQEFPSVTLLVPTPVFLSSKRKHAELVMSSKLSREAQTSQ